MPSVSDKKGNVVLRIAKDGKCQFLVGEENPRLRELATKMGGVTERASWVTPQNWFLKFWFLTLRKWFGDRGRVAAWTRTWKCVWQADLRLSGGPVVREFPNRESAIKFEVMWLTLTKELLEKMGGGVTTLTENHYERAEDTKLSLSQGDGVGN